MPPPFMRKRRARHFDVSVGTHRPIVSLRKRSIRIVLSRETFSRLLAPFRQRLRLVVPLIVLIGVGIGAGYSWHAHAEAFLSPTSCLGAWEGSANASGPPDVFGQSDDEYTYQNSATVSGALAQIFCGDFTGDKPEGSVPTTIALSFSLASKQLANVPGPSGVTGDTFASSTNAIIDAPTDSGSLLIPVSPNQTPAPDAPTRDTVPAAPTSFVPFRPLFNLFSVQRVYAQDVPATPVTTFADDSFAEVLYTLDGTTWISLGRISWDNVRAANFIIPLDNVRSWKDISKFQVSIRTLSTISPNQRLFLDGMKLTVGYEPIAEKTEALVPNTAYTEQELQTVVVHPHFNDGSTNIIFYSGASTSTASYAAETTGHGSLPLSTYYAPLPGPGGHVMIEYKNDGGTFGCTGMSASACMADPHFISRSDFMVTPD